jgi:hypothetical protein
MCATLCVHCTINVLSDLLLDCDAFLYDVCVSFEL